MRRLPLTCLLAGLLLSPLAACGEDDPKAALQGDWTGDFGGQVLTLTLAADGKLTMRASSGGSATAEGSWSLADGKLTLDLTSATGRSEALTCDYTIKDGVLRLAGSDPDCAQAPDLKKVS